MATEPITDADLDSLDREVQAASFEHRYVAPDVFLPVLAALRAARAENAKLRAVAELLITSSAHHTWPKMKGVLRDAGYE